MYKLSEVDRRNLISGIASQDKCNGVLSDEIEKNIAATLPVIPGLVPGMSTDERVSVMSKAAAESRAAFIQMYGDPFGCELITEKIADHSMPFLDTVLVNAELKFA